MSGRYDSRTTVFSAEGRLYQVEYAMEAISHAGSCIGMLTREGIVLIAEKKMSHKLLETKQESQEKIYKIDDTLLVAVAGITSDANTLVNYCRLVSGKHKMQFREPICIEELVQKVSNLKQGYTQYGGLRPFGVSIIYAGYDENYKYQIYVSDPSGNYCGWKAIGIGSNSSSAQSMLKNEYREDMTLQEGKELAVKIFKKFGEEALMTPEKIEIRVLKRSEITGEIEVVYVRKNEIQDLLNKVSSENNDGSGQDPEMSPPRLGKEPTFSSTIS